MNLFKTFRQAVNNQITAMVTRDVFMVDVSGDDLWETYLSAFPEGTDPIFQERTEHDCQCCKQFIRGIGGMVTVENGKLVSVWDIETPSFYQEVADALSAKVKSGNIKGLYRYFQDNVGVNRNYSEKHDMMFDHFHYKLPASLVLKDSGSLNGDAVANKEVLGRSLNEISLESIETVQELISQNSLYRGEEHLRTVKALRKAKVSYDKVRGDKDLWLWKESVKLKQGGRFKNTVIGTLLADLSDGVDLERAVKKFEDKVAPHNYKRPTALITQGMIKKAQEKVVELGMEESLYRRYAKLSDITVNNVLFADRSAAVKMGGVFDDLAPTKIDKPNFDKVQEVTADKFVKDILPHADSVELMVENKHVSNFVSLIAPENAEAPNMFKWGNNFSWSYNGGVTDSIKERVKAAGGDVTGDLRASLSWYNSDDLDIHLKEPNGTHIYYSNKRSAMGGNLDVDMNAGGPSSRTPVENITYPSARNLQDGVYKVIVHNYTKRESIDGGFDLQIEFLGDVYNFHYDKHLRDGEKVVAAEIILKNGKVTIKSDLQSESASQEVWGVNTQQFQKVATIMNSPNHWDGEETGNRHLFFMLEGCVNPESSRGFYNEFLNNDLTEHRKVFEVLGSKMKVEESDEQLSGLGFSSTKKDAIILKVSGKFNRTIKVNF